MLTPPWCVPPQQTIHVEFNLSAEHYGVPINNEMLPRPDLTNQITGVLLCYWEEPIAVSGDIKAMFPQVKVPEQQRNYIRFHW